jgi:competence protein ComEA
VPPVSGAAGGATVPGGGLLDLNSADAASLETLPRVGPALAQRILDWREANGGFASVEQLLEVSGIGAKTLDGFRELVTVR